MSNLDHPTDFDAKIGHNAQNVKSVIENPHIPDNASLAHILDKIDSSAHVDSVTSSLSPTGRTVLRDIQQLAHTSKDGLLEKNEGNHLQQAIAHAAVAIQKTETSHLSKEIKGVDVIKKDLTMSLQKIISVSKLIMSSKNFRKEIEAFWAIIMEIITYNTGITTNDVTNAKMETIIAKDKFKSLAQSNDGARSSAHRGVDTFANLVDGVVPQDVRGKADPLVKGVVSGELDFTTAVKEVYTSVKGKAKHLEIPSESREHLVSRMKQNILDIQNDPQVKQGISDLVDIFYDLVETAEIAVEDVENQISLAGTVNSADVEAKLALYHIKAVIENFANHKSLDPIIMAFKDFASKLRNDPDLKAYLDDWKYFIKKSISDVNFIDRDQYPEDAKRIARFGNDLLSQMYSSDVQHISDLMRDFISGFSEDAFNKNVKDDVTSLIRDLFFDSRGNPVIKPELFSDFGKLLPLLTQKIAYIPIPHIEIDDPDYHIILDNIVVRCDGLLPNYVHVRADGVMDTRDELTAKSAISINVSHIQASAQNIRFYIRKKTGFRLSERGYADFQLYGQGVAAAVQIVPFVNETEKGIRLDKCKVSLDKLKVHLHGTKRDLLYKMISPLVNKIAKEKITNAITDQLYKVFIKAERTSPVAMRAPARAVIAERGHHHLPSEEEMRKYRNQIPPINPETGYPSYILTPSISVTPVSTHD